MRIGFDRSGSASIIDTRLDPEGTAIGFDFIVSTRTYQARYNGESITAATQDAMTQPASDRFAGPNSRLDRAPLVIAPSLGSTYSGLVLWSDNNGSGLGDSGTRSVLRYLLFGARTAPADLPPSGAPTFTGTSIVTGPGPGSGSGDTASMIVDFAAHTFRGTTAFTPASAGGTGSSTRPPTEAPQPITFSGTLDPVTGRISGTATHTLSGATGRFEGALYGPRGVEAALVFTIAGADGARYWGIVGGRS